MIITGRRIRNVTRHLGEIREGQPIILGLSDLDRFAYQLGQFGFSAAPRNGETVLPPSSFGPVSRFNSEGRWIVHRDQEMETAYRQVEWTWTERHGPDTVERTGIRDVPYPRYPRSFDPPPSVEMSVTADEHGSRLLVSPTTIYTPANHERIRHTVNLFLQIFRECQVIEEGPEGPRPVPIRRLNWKILPQGRMPWVQLREALGPIIERVPKGKQPVIERRLQAVHAHNPEFQATGTGGFDGYVIFAFPDRRMFILESNHFGNATYVFGDDWETLSQMTKADILNDRRHRDRLVHRQGWDEQLERLFA